MNPFLRYFALFLILSSCYNDLKKQVNFTAQQSKNNLKISSTIKDIVTHDQGFAKKTHRIIERLLVKFLKTQSTWQSNTFLRSSRSFTA